MTNISLILTHTQYFIIGTPEMRGRSPNMRGTLVPKSRNYQFDRDLDVIEVNFFIKMNY